MKDNGEASVLGVPSLGIEYSLLFISLETKLLNFSRAQFPHPNNEEVKSTSVFLKINVAPSMGDN